MFMKDLLDLIKNIQLKMVAFQDALHIVNVGRITELK